MAKIWRQKYSGKIAKGGGWTTFPQNPMSRIGPRSIQRPAEVWFVRVCSFTFVFHNLEQVEACLAYYSAKTHPSNIIPKEKLAADLGHEWQQLRGWDIERWFERLPMYLLETPKRIKVVKALTETQTLWKRQIGSKGI